MSSVIHMPVISHFTKDTVVFEDGTSVSDVDAVILGTGYKMLWSYLSPPHGNALLVNRDEPTSINSTTALKVTTNTHYVFPLWNYVFSVSSALPTTALAFIGLIEGPADPTVVSLQGLLVAHAYADASLLPSRETMLSDVVVREDYIRAHGSNPYILGHKLFATPSDPWDFQEDLARWLQDRGVPVRTEPGTGNYVDKWRRVNLESLLLFKSGWARIQSLGEEAKWLAGLETVEEWGDLLRRIVDWERAQEEK